MIYKTHEATEIIDIYQIMINLKFILLFKFLVHSVSFIILI